MGNTERVGHGSHGSSNISEQTTGKNETGRVFLTPDGLKKLANIEEYSQDSDGAVAQEYTYALISLGFSVKQGRKGLEVSKNEGKKAKTVLNPTTVRSFIQERARELLPIPVVDEPKVAEVAQNVKEPGSPNISRETHASHKGVPPMVWEYVSRLNPEGVDNKSAWPKEVLETLTYIGATDIQIGDTNRISFMVPDRGGVEIVEKNLSRKGAEFFLKKRSLVEETFRNKSKNKEAKKKTPIEQGNPPLDKKVDGDIRGNIIPVAIDGQTSNRAESKQETGEVVPVVPWSPDILSQLRETYDDVQVVDGNVVCTLASDGFNGEKVTRYTPEEARNFLSLFKDTGDFPEVDNVPQVHNSGEGALEKEILDGLRGDAPVADGINRERIALAQGNAEDAVIVEEKTGEQIQDEIKARVAHRREIFASIPPDDKEDSESSQEVEARIREVLSTSSFEELYTIIDSYEEVQGSKQTYTAERLKELIEAFRRSGSDSDLERITNTYKIRDKVIELYTTEYEKELEKKVSAERESMMKEQNEGKTEEEVNNKINEEKAQAALGQFVAVEKRLVEDRKEAIAYTKMKPIVEPSERWNAPQKEFLEKQKAELIRRQKEKTFNVQNALHSEMHKKEQQAKILGEKEKVRDAFGKEFEKFESRFGISREELARIPGFEKLELGQMKLAYANLEEYASSKEDGFIKSVWKGIRMTDKEKVAGGMEQYGEVLTSLVSSLETYGPKVHVGPFGDLSPDLVDINFHGKRGERGPQWIAAREVNRTAQALTKLSPSWLENGMGTTLDKMPKVLSFFNKFLPSQKRMEEFKRGQKSFELAKEKLATAMREAGESDGVIAQKLIEVDGRVAQLQYLQNAPEAVAEIQSIPDESVWKRIGKAMIKKENIAYFAGGFLSRAALSGVMGVVAGPLVATTIGGIRGWNRAAAELRERDRQARAGKSDTSKEALNIVHASQEMNINGEVQDRGMTQRMQLIINEVYQINEKIAVASERRDDDALSHLNEERDKIVRRLGSRAEYALDKLNLHRINFGTPDTRAKNMADFFEVLGIAQAMVADTVIKDTNILSYKSRIAEELDKLLSKREQTIHDARLSRKRMQTIQAMVISAGFSGAGVLAAHEVAVDRFGLGEKVKDLAQSAKEYVGWGNGTSSLAEATRGATSSEALTQPIVEGVQAPYSAEPYTVKSGDTLSQILKDKLEEGTRDIGSGRVQNTAMMDVLRSLTPEQLKEIGVTSGNMNLIRPGETINIDKLTGMYDAKLSAEGGGTLFSPPSQAGIQSERLVPGPRVNSDDPTRIDLGRQEPIVPAASPDLVSAESIAQNAEYQSSLTESRLGAATFPQESDNDIIPRNEWTAKPEAPQFPSAIESSPRLVNTFIKPYMPLNEFEALRNQPITAIDVRGMDVSKGIPPSVQKLSALREILVKQFGVMPQVVDNKVETVGEYLTRATATIEKDFTGTPEGVANMKQVMNEYNKLVYAIDRATPTTPSGQGMYAQNKIPMTNAEKVANFLRTPPPPDTVYEPYKIIPGTNKGERRLTDAARQLFRGRKS